MFLIVRPVAIGNLREKYHPVIAAPGFEIFAVQFDFNRVLQALMEREFGARDTRFPMEERIRMFGEPLIEGNFLKCRIERAVAGGRLGRQDSAEKEQC